MFEIPIFHQPKKLTKNIKINENTEKNLSAAKKIIFSAKRGKFVIKIKKKKIRGRNDKKKLKTTMEENFLSWESNFNLDEFFFCQRGSEKWKKKNEEEEKEEEEQ